MQQRFKSPALWLSVFSLISFVLKDWLSIEVPKMDVFIELLLAVLAGLGILNNPTDKTRF